MKRDRHQQRTPAGSARDQQRRQAGRRAGEITADVKPAGNRLEAAIGLGVRQFRKQAGLGIIDLARRAQLSPGMLSKIENGAISPSLATLQSVARALQVPVTSLLRDFEEVSDTTFVR